MILGGGGGEREREYFIGEKIDAHEDSVRTGRKAWAGCSKVQARVPSAFLFYFTTFLPWSSIESK